jgi:apolipoprotein N-acyltransferase
MEMELKKGIEQNEDFDGRNAAYVVGGVLLAATFWASPSMGFLFAIALLVCVAVCAIVLLLACAIGFCDSAVARLWRREEVGEVREVRRNVKMPSRAASA